MLYRRICLGDRKTTSGSIFSESVVAFCGILIVLLPLADLVNFLMGASVCNLIAFQAAAAAAPCSTLAGSLAAMKNQTRRVTSSLLGHLCKMKPIKGYQGCGVDLYVIVTNYSSNERQVFGPNCVVLPPIDTSTYTYEYQAVSCYEIEPMPGTSFLSMFRDVAIVCKPTTITFSCTRMVECPEGLAGPGVLPMFTSHASNTAVQHWSKTCQLSYLQTTTTNLPRRSSARRSSSGLETDVNRLSI